MVCYDPIKVSIQQSVNIILQFFLGEGRKTVEGGAEGPCHMPTTVEIIPSVLCVNSQNRKVAVWRGHCYYAILEAGF